MSVLSQFFPGGSAGEGFIDVETFIVSGGGGGGGSYPQAVAPGYIGGGGGGGAVFHGFLSIKPGSVCPVVVGGGGAAGPQAAPGGAPGSNGSDSSVTTPVTTLTVVGGGGGGTGGVQLEPGLPGGTGGGGGGYFIPAPPYPSGKGGRSIYHSGTVAKLAIDDGNPGNTGWTKGLMGGSVTSNKYGTYHGYPGIGNAVYYANPTLPSIGGSFQGGGAGGHGGGMNIGNWFTSNIAGISSDYGVGGFNPAFGVTYPTPATGTGPNLAAGGLGANSATGALATAGSSGMVILRYPTQFAASPSFPGATDISPATPGYRTYRFTSPGSITLP